MDPLNAIGVEIGNHSDEVSVKHLPIDHFHLVCCEIGNNFDCIVCIELGPRGGVNEYLTAAKNLGVWWLTCFLH